MKCKECGQEVKEEHWELLEGDDEWDGDNRKPQGVLKRVRPHKDLKWSYYVEEDWDGLWFWRKKK